MADRVSAGQGETAEQDAETVKRAVAYAPERQFHDGLAAVERLLVRVREARDEGYDEGKAAVLEHVVCSICGDDHDRDESAPCDGCEPITFDEWCENVGRRVQEAERVLREILSPAARPADHIRIARKALAVLGGGDGQ